MGKHPQQYIHSVARTVMGQIGSVRYSYSNGYSEADEDSYPHMLWQAEGVWVMMALRKMGPQAHGKIAACGVEHNSPSGSTCYYEVNECRDLAAAPKGDEALIYLASYVVVAAMVDIIRANVQSLRDDEKRREDEFDRGMAAYIHGAPNHISQTR